jgi:predicted DNA-binding transcriptional regulator AlpA
VTARELARRCDVSIGTVRRWARTGIGPRPVRIGARAVRYRPEDVRVWTDGGASANPELRAYVAASRATQGLPPVITDPATLERVAAVLRLVTITEPAPPSPRTRPKTSGAVGLADSGGEPAA